MNIPANTMTTFFFPEERAGFCLPLLLSPYAAPAPSRTIMIEAFRRHQHFYFGKELLVKYRMNVLLMKSLPIFTKGAECGFQNTSFTIFPRIELL